MSWFQNLFDARRKISAWRTEYNERRPHSSLGYRTPMEFAAMATSYGIDIGGRSLAFPVTPPCVRVRTRRFGRIKLRSCRTDWVAPDDQSTWTAWRRRAPGYDLSAKAPNENQPCAQPGLGRDQAAAKRRNASFRIATSSRRQIVGDAESTDSNGAAWSVSGSSRSSPANHEGIGPVPGP